MRRILFLIVLLCSWVPETVWAVIPEPLVMERGKNNEKFVFGSGLRIVLARLEFTTEAKALQGILKDRTGITAEIVKEGKFFANTVYLNFSDQVDGEEGYILEVKKKGITIEARAAAGMFYGMMTLDQLLAEQGVGKKIRELAAVRIIDRPRFSYRALMLDPARHFLPVQDIRFFIDQMARLKFNKLQLHLTDDQGWRVEIRKYPELTKIGAFRDAKSGSHGPHNGYYTQDELKQLVEYAADRHIEIIPELDIPGHTVALLAAYPELGCTMTDTLPKVIGKTLDMMICAGNEQCYRLYSDIIGEVSTIFPSKYIHLGGDEAVLEKNWAHCSRCRALMKQLGYEKPRQLMGYFFSRMNEALVRNKKEPMLWCELDRPWMPANELLFEYPAESVLFTWRYGLTPKCIELTREKGLKLIAAPGEYCYFDYPQRKGDLPDLVTWGMPVLSLEQAYRFDPGYGLPADRQAHVLGVAALLWGECIQDMSRVCYMAFPRA